MNTIACPPSEVKPEPRDDAGDLALLADGDDPGHAQDAPWWETMPWSEELDTPIGLADLDDDDARWAARIAGGGPGLPMTDLDLDDRLIERLGCVEYPA